MAGHHRVTVEELFARMEPEEFYHWMVLEKLEPFGEYGAWLRAGVIASTIANVNPGKDQKALKPEDFIPRFESETETAEVEGQQANLLLALAKAHNAGLAAREKLEKANATAYRDRELRKKTQGAVANRKEQGSHEGNKAGRGTDPLRSR